MNYIESIKDGFKLINKNWQLVVIQVILIIISSLGFFVIVGIPFAIAFILFGIDLTKFTDIKDMLSIFENSSGLISRYFGLLIIVIASFLLYVIVIGILSLYIFAGSIGVIGKSLRDRNEKFTTHIFFDEAKRLFPRLLGFTFAIGLIMILIAFFLGILGGGIGALISFAKSKDSTPALFVITFFSLILALIVLVFILGMLSITIYGVASLLFKGTGPLKSIKESIHYLIRNPNAFWLYILLFGGYLFVSFILILLKYPFSFLPIIGTILFSPLHLISYAFETYLGLAFIAAILTYYYSTEIQPSSVVEVSTVQDTLNKSRM
ncbi:MAG: hypothetical protein IBX72_02030 [Nitrospirae bacterium]|nr:hypothetical protein [Nitrospirota bacterium]